jgi:SpoIIAA-like
MQAGRRHKGRSSRNARTAAGYLHVVIETLDAMPAGTVGFRATGELTAGDYRDVLVPALRAAVESGSLRAVFVIGREYEGFDLGAVKEDLKGLAPLALQHRDAWKRVAAVTDVEWLAKAVETFRWLMPGEVRVFALDELEAAKNWVAG